MDQHILHIRLQLLGLIEAYWNVNEDLEGDENGKQSGLIEAYWNVNAIAEAIVKLLSLGLIEAYWNVNYSEAHLKKYSLH